MAIAAVAWLLLAASPAAAQVGAEPAQATQQAAESAWWAVPVADLGGAVFGFAAGAAIGLIAYECEASCWGGGHAWLEGGVVGAGIGAGVGVIATTVVLLATGPSTTPDATAVVVARPELVYAGVRVAF